MPAFIPPKANPLHDFVRSARVGLWPALLLSSFAYAHLLRYPSAETLVIALDLCIVASVVFLFNDVRDAQIDAANNVHRWSISSRSDVAMFAIAMASSLFAIAVSAAILTPMAVAGVFVTLLLGLAYSLVFKRVLLVGNLVAALLSISPGVIMYVDGGLADARRGIAAIFLGCAFLFLLSREIRFDEYDIAGDSIGGRRTLPMVLGRTGLNVLHAVLMIVSLGVLFATIAVAGRFSPMANGTLALLAATVGFALTALAYGSNSKEFFYKSTRIVLLIAPLAMLVGF